MSTVLFPDGRVGDTGVFGIEQHTHQTAAPVPPPVPQGPPTLVSTHYRLFFNNTAETITIPLTAGQIIENVFLRGMIPFGANALLEFVYDSEIFTIPLDLLETHQVQIPQRTTALSLNFTPGPFGEAVLEYQVYTPVD